MHLGRHFKHMEQVSEAIEMWKTVGHFQEEGTYDFCWKAELLKAGSERVV